MQGAPPPQDPFFGSSPFYYIAEKVRPFYMVGKFGKFFFIVSVNSVFSSPPPLLSVLLLKILLRKLLRKTPLFLVSVNSVFSLGLLSVCSFGSSRAAPRFLVVPLEFLSSSLSEQRPFYILRKLRKFNFVYRPVNLWYTDL